MNTQAAAPVLTFKAVEASTLAGAFVALLKRDLEPEEWAAMRVANAGNGDDACASHDFCDANMMMLEALQAVTGEADAYPHSPDDVSLWNEAWAIAKREALTESRDLEAMTADLAAYQEREGLEPSCALEALMAEDLTDAQRAWLSAFVAQWEAVQAAEDAA